MDTIYPPIKSAVPYEIKQFIYLYCTIMVTIYPSVKSEVTNEIKQYIHLYPSVFYLYPSVSVSLSICICIHLYLYLYPSVSVSISICIVLSWIQSWIFLFIHQILWMFLYTKSWILTQIFWISS